jgi:hypothetical protein
MHRRGKVRDQYSRPYPTHLEQKRHQRAAVVMGGINVKMFAHLRSGA